MKRGTNLDKKAGLSHANSSWRSKARAATTEGNGVIGSSNSNLFPGSLDQCHCRRRLELQSNAAMEKVAGTLCMEKRSISDP